MVVKNFKELSVWKLGVEIVTEIYKVTRSYPSEEKFGIISQMRRAAVSIPSNVAEGFNRRHSKEFARFLGIAQGSCGELETQLEISLRLGFINLQQIERLFEKMDHEQKMLNKLIHSLNN
jgi:four helix bundle protein